MRDDLVEGSAGDLSEPVVEPGVLTVSGQDAVLVTDGAPAAAGYDVPARALLHGPLLSW